MTELFRTWAEIDIDALLQNFDAIKARVGNKKITAVVKANAYGHGAVNIAKALRDRADGFAVATLEEAIELRQSGCEKDIMILSPVQKKQFGHCVRYDLLPVIFSTEAAHELALAAKKQKKTARAYLAVDTGMSRIGVDCGKNGVLEAKEILAVKNLKIEGVVSHFACADTADDSITQSQNENLHAFLNQLSQDVKLPETVSISNSAAIIDYSEKYDMVRAGIALYGMYPSEHVSKENLPLRPVLSLKTKISQIKTVPAGTGISYGHTFVTSKPTRVATLCAGYADGIPIALSNAGRVIIGGKYANIIGRVCMDQMMVDISSVDGVKVGDTATIIGRQSGALITAEEIASLASTINYDVVCRLDFRVPRVYVKDGKIVDVFSYIGNEIY